MEPWNQLCCTTHTAHKTIVPIDSESKTIQLLLVESGLLIYGTDIYSDSSTSWTSDFIYPGHRLILTSVTLIQLMIEVYDLTDMS